MVFTGIPVFLDPPNWQQDQRGETGVSAAIRGGAGGSLASNNPQISIIHPTPPPELIPPTMAVVGSTRPTLMADRARLAKVQPPDTALQCPRCESTNTKFCYYNNYSLSQPRHFCKTCRRYWTKGGTLRNVPVGGGCRRNKRSKNSRSMDRVQSIETSSATSSGGVTMVSSGNCTGELIGIDNHVLPFHPSLHGLSDYGGSATAGFGFSGREFRSSAGGSTSLGLDFMVASENAEGENHGQWRMQQQHLPVLPFPHPLLLPYNGGEGLTEHQYLATAVAQLKTRPPISNLEDSSNLIKLEDDGSQNLTYFSGNGWADLSNFNPPTTSSLL